MSVTGQKIFFPAIDHVFKASPVPGCGEEENHGRRTASAECYCTKLKCVSKLLIIKEIVVEAAGVEPASENVTGQETTCLFAFMPQPLGVTPVRDVRGPRSERTRNASR